MELTQEDGITPGIYRTLFNTAHGVPGIREPRYESHKISTILERLRLIKGECIRFQERAYFQTIEDFLETWSQGYIEGSPLEKKGFELFYVNWKRGSPFFKIGEHEGIRMMGDREDLKPIMILGDNNGMNDQDGYLNLGVNDFRNQTSLVYRLKLNMMDGNREESIDLTSNNPKQLRTDLRYYLYDGQQKFPIDSPNPSKSRDNAWTAIGINPLRVYEEIENMGFIFLG